MTSCRKWRCCKPRVEEPIAGNRHDGSCGGGGVQKSNECRLYPTPGNSNALRPIAMPTIKDKALQRATAAVLNGIYEQDFLDTSFGGRTERREHQAIATVREHIRRKPINWI